MFYTDEALLHSAEPKNAGEYFYKINKIYKRAAVFHVGDIVQNNGYFPLLYGKLCADVTYNSFAYGEKIDLLAVNYSDCLEDGSFAITSVPKNAGRLDNSRRRFQRNFNVLFGYNRRLVFRRSQQIIVRKSVCKFGVFRASDLDVEYGSALVYPTGADNFSYADGSLAIVEGDN